MLDLLLEQQGSLGLIPLNGDLKQNYCYLVWRLTACQYLVNC